MTYQITPIALNDSAAPSQDVAFIGPPASGSAGVSGWPSTFRYALFSCWFEFPTGSGSGTQAFIDFDWEGPPNFGFTVTAFANTTSGINFTARDGTGVIGSQNRPTPGDITGTWNNLLVSADSVGNLLQMYLNDVAIPEGSGPPVWNNTNQISNGSSDFNIFTSGVVTGDSFCAAEVYATSPAAFFDLSVTANRRKFIDGSGDPVDLGTNGTGPTGVQPIVLLRIPGSGSAADFLTNDGSSGAFVAARSGGGSASIRLCAGGPYPPTPPPETQFATIGDTWFGPTASFVDMRVAANRRLFVSQTGATQFLGPSGAVPFGSVPPVFLTRQSPAAADAFANNQGSGGAFIINGGTLAEPPSIPPCSVYELVTVFNSIQENTPQGADPQVRLSYSDDGGRTWSTLKKWRSMGKIGEYLQRLRWLKMGQFRQRLIRLEITDPVRRNIVGFYQDIGEGMG